jgi:hypothetical protein
MKRVCLMLVVSWLLQANVPVLADDSFPPTWRGNYGTMTAGWDNWGQEGMGPRSVDLRENQLIQANPGGFSSLWPARAYFGSNVYCHDTLWGRQSVLEVLGVGPLSFYFEDYPGNEHKDMSIQITFRPGYGTVVGFWKGTSQFDPNTPPWSYPDYVPAIVQNSVVHADGWQTNSYALSFDPNPNYEGFAINFGTHDFDYPVFIDQVVVDTQCVPEPGAIALLGFVGLVATRRSTR